MQVYTKHQLFSLSLSHLQIEELEPGLVVWVCNPSYSGDREGRVASSWPAWVTELEG